MLELGVKALLAYLLGSIIGGLIVGELRGGVDIRTMGSGNAGGTNALRTRGPMFAFWVMVIDAGKGWVAAAVLPELQLPFVGIDRRSTVSGWRSRVPRPSWLGTSTRYGMDSAAARARPR